MTPSNPARSRPGVVFDCNIFVQAVVFEQSKAAWCLRHVDRGDVELFVSKSVLAELRRVLAYEQVLAISPNMIPERIEAFMRRLMFRATFVRRVRHVMDYPRDPKDEPYIDLAVTAKCDFLVTRDKDLLSLMTGHSPICKRFRRIARNLRMVEPEQFLDLFEKSQPGSY